MGDETRNFRSVYYEKVGFRGVEEKKSLEILLKENPPDLQKLSQFTARFSLPSLHRQNVWKLFLDVSSPDCQTDDLVLKEQAALSVSLQRALQVMRLINDKTSNAHKLALMYLLETGHLNLEVDHQLLSPSVCNLIHIADCFDKVSPPFDNVYWLYRNFVSRFANQRQLIPSMVSKCLNCLQQEDNLLYTHLTKAGDLNILPIGSWFQRCFAGTLHVNSVIKIWDKVIGGNSLKTLPSLSRVILTTLRPQLLALNDRTELKSYLLKPIPLDLSDVVVSKVFEM